MIIDEVIQPIAHLFQLREREALHVRLNPLNFAHGRRIAQHQCSGKGQKTPWHALAIRALKLKLLTLDTLRRLFPEP